MGDDAEVRIRVGCDFRYKSMGDTPSIWQVRPRPEGPHVLESQRWGTDPHVPFTSYIDRYGNLCDRLVLPEGQVSISYDAVVEVPDGVDENATHARQLPVESLPDDALLYLLPSRFCLSDVLLESAWDLFGATPPGWERVQAVCDWAHQNVRFDYLQTTPFTTAADVFHSRVGVCRDFAHLGLTFCRSLNIPARYVFGYLPDIGVPPPDSPMDFCAWFEAYLDGRWYTFDPRNNVPRTGRVVIGRGRDAVDVAMVTTYGAPQLEEMKVWADEA